MLVPGRGQQSGPGLYGREGRTVTPSVRTSALYRTIKLFGKAGWTVVKCRCQQITTISSSWPTIDTDSHTDLAWVHSSVCTYRELERILKEGFRRREWEDMYLKFIFVSLFFLKVSISFILI